ncbi:hypothetical protein [Acididesulfobacillus acetoxydans]|uniref:hypothetical protein n=1 Tax=Acididesulfobacillus acetoxydans TaxID=1561005 RepID=UPI001F0D9D9B|nr:hypothetical protein [Acididesulfobacillus acetoxydans]
MWPFLKTAQNQLASQASAPALQNRMVTELLASLSDPRADIPRETLEVEVDLHILPRSTGTAHLQLGLGLQRYTSLKILDSSPVFIKGRPSNSAGALLRPCPAHLGA